MSIVGLVKGKFSKTLRMLAAVVLTASLFLAIAPPDKAEASWWNGSWSDRMVISFNGTGLSANMTEFPLTLYFDSSNLDFSAVAANGTDIRFVDSDDATELYYERVIWSDVAGSENATLIVNVPIIEGGANFTDYIYMYYGNGGASDAHNPTETWNGTGASLVWHLYSETNNGSTIYDSTLNDNDGTNNGTTWSATGRIFDGTNFISAPNDASLNMGTDNFSISLIMESDNKSSTDYWVMKGDAAAGSGWYGLRTEQTTGRLRGYIDDGSTLAGTQSLIDYCDGTIHMANVAYNRQGNATIYEDDNASTDPDNITAVSGSVDNATTNFYVGSNLLGGVTQAYPDGIVTDVVVYKDRVLSADEAEWLYALNIHTASGTWGGSNYVTFGGTNPIPSVGTPSISGVSMTAAGVTTGTMSCNVTEIGGTPGGTYYFQLGTATGVYTINTTATAWTGAGALTSSIPANLVPGGTYYYRMYVTTALGDNQSAEGNFTLTMPTVTTVASTYSGGSTVTLNGNVSNLGVASTASYFTQYGTTSGVYTDTATDTINATGAYTDSVTAPNTDTTLYYRAAVTVGANTTYGSELSVSIPSGAGGNMLKVILRVLVAMAILVGVLISATKFGGMAFLMSSVIGVIAFVIINALITNL